MTWRWLAALVLTAGPLAASAATHTVGIDIGHANAGDMRCPPAEVGVCKHDDDAYRLYYELAPSKTVGFRITRLVLNELRLTTAADELFIPSEISSTISEISVTYAWPVHKHIVLRGRAGLAQWEEIRFRGSFFDQKRSDGWTPVMGFGVDFGSKRIRAGLSADLYPSVGDAGYVGYYGIGVRFVFGSYTP
jgi:hypothetical protein